MNEPLTDEEYAQLLQLGGDNELASARMKQQLAMADQLRSISTPQTRSAGGQIYAPGKLEALSGILGGAASGAMQAKGMQGGEQMAMNNQKQRALMLRGILGGRPQQGLQQQNPLAPQPMGMPQQPMAPQGVPNWQQQYPEF